MSCSIDCKTVEVRIPHWEDHGNLTNHWPYSITQYLRDIEEIHEHKRCDPLITIEQNHSSMESTVTISCCGDSMSKRQQQHREDFFRDNQARTPTLVTIEGGEFLETDTPYNAAFVAAIKQKIPARDRYWDKQTRRWGVKVTYRAVLTELLLNTFGGQLDERVEEPSTLAKVTRDQDKLVADAVAKARASLIKARGAERLVI